MLAMTGIEDLREKREEVNRSIAKDEEEKGPLLAPALKPRRRTYTHANSCRCSARP